MHLAKLCSAGEVLPKWKPRLEKIDGLVGVGVNNEATDFEAGK